ncbi:MAG: PfkB family carbohydrate kinase [Ilumatobacteraceae bacterium]
MSGSSDDAPVVIVVGAVNVDLVVAAPRLPGPGETVVGGGLQTFGGGKGANAAVAAARAGAKVRLIAAVGDDDNGVAAVCELRDEGIEVGDVAVLAGQATGVALIVVDGRGENQIAVGSGANAAITVDHVGRCLAAALPTAGCVLVSTEVPAAVVAAAVEAASTAGVMCILNPAPVVPVVVELLQFRPILTPNETELRDLAALLGSTAGDSTAARAAHIAARSEQAVVVTLGADGALVVPANQGAQQVAAPAVDVRDTTGAGDTFNGVLAMRLAAGDELRVAVPVAIAAAALSVTEVGARGGMPTAAAIDAVVQP